MFLKIRALILYWGDGIDDWKDGTKLLARLDVMTATLDLGKIWT